MGAWAHRRMGAFRKMGKPVFEDLQAGPFIVHVTEVKGKAVKTCFKERNALFSADRQVLYTDTRGHTGTNQRVTCLPSNACPRTATNPNPVFHLPVSGHGRVSPLQSHPSSVLGRGYSAPDGRVHGCMSAWVHGHMVARAHVYVDAWHGHNEGMGMWGGHMG